MERRIGTISRGLRAPIVKEGDDLKKIVVETLLNCVDHGIFKSGKKMSWRLLNRFWQGHRPLRHHRSAGF